MDALNVNNSLLTSMSEDLRNSLQPFHLLYSANAQGALTSTLNYKGGDYSNFMIGIPFCDSEDFMGGISTTGTVQIELTGERRLLPDIKYRATAICFEDALLKINAVKPSGRPQIEIINADITQILAGAAV